jgi:hypothetical protein
MPLLELQGFTIARYFSRGGGSEDPTPNEKKKYQKTPLSMEYDANIYFYQLIVKLLHEDSTYPFLFAMLYKEESRTDYTYVLPLVKPGLGGPHAPKILSKDFDKNSEKILADYWTLMDRDPDKKLPYYYGSLLFDYSKSEEWYKSGTLTIEVKIGTGKSNNKVDQWSITQKYRWNIPKYIPPSPKGNR